jgi:hypothetical protein
LKEHRLDEFWDDFTTMARKIPAEPVREKRGFG